MMETKNTYPVFKPDQVLTNGHLNDMFNYLDQQDRLSRTKLIGSGIVCGLEITYKNDSISISKGCGLTSQGFLITLCGHEFTYYISYDTPNLPDTDDFHFLKQCGKVSDSNIPFYKKEFESGILQLLTTAQFNDLNNNDKQNAVVISNKTPVSLKDYVVVLFLETAEESLKNCDTSDCNDKGSQINFEIKALLVKKDDMDNRTILQKAKTASIKSTFIHEFPHLELKRYNVRVKDIPDANTLFKGFSDLLDNETLDNLSKNLINCFAKYSHLLNEGNSNPFNILKQGLLKNYRDIIYTNYTFLIQYFYDFIDDLIKAVHEFEYKAFDIMGECCGDEMKFPFHLMLGEAIINTNENVHSAYRQYFTYSPLFDAQNQKLGEIRSLFTRMKLMVQKFLLNEKELQNFLSEHNGIKITPSQYGHYFLSERCIPYYYNVMPNENNDKSEDLYRFWNYDKTRRGNEHYNLGYNSNQYSPLIDTVKNPLNYDIECFNFFRIEGHIGREVNKALPEIKSIQQTFNLPFDVIALSGDHLGAIVKGDELGYNNRLGYPLKKDLNNYFKKHTGLEHKAGVPKGGTFVLVYHEENRNQIKIEAPTLDLIIIDNRVKKQLKTHKVSEDIINKISKSIMGNSDFPLIPRFKPLVGMVIADFYIPYMCCSDSASVENTLPEQPNEQILSIEIDKEFCGNDEQSHSFNTNPIGGIIKIDGNQVFANKIIPANYQAGFHKLEYSISEKSIATIFEIVPYPKVELTKKIDINSGIVTFTISPDTRSNAIFSINYGDDIIESILENSFEHRYKRGVFQGELHVIDGPCQASFEFNVDNPGPPA